MKLACRCGQVQGEIDPARSYARATCYCRDCRAFARWLGGAGLLDAAGGSDILAMAPDGLRLTRGADQLACMSLGPRGLLRWYARCCRTPMGNLPRNPKLFYLGVPVAALAAPAADVDQTYGPPGRIRINPESATGNVLPTRMASLRGTLRIVRKLLAARLAGRSRSVFFDAESGTPVRSPEVLTLEQRRELAGRD
ncbi:MAG: hypothetical protein KGL91_10940 [Xanthomonadaceae bacterium]|nr:hypothetical protein [Xanthomonadaceae bacterium]